MKKINILILLFVFGFCLINTSCDDGFDELNTSEIAINELDPVYVLNHAVYRTSSHFDRHTLNYEISIVQQMITPFGVSLAGANYNQENFTYMDNTWQNNYESVIRNTVDVISKTKDDPDRSNVYNMARILRAFSGIVLTDTYGDVPFINAGLGYIDGQGSPVYDTQEAIYDYVLSELEAATAALDVNGRIETGDVLYAGDITKWKRFGYSLMLRAAMRLTKVKPAKAEEYVKKAVAGGVMQSNDDIAMVRHSSNFPNLVGSQLNGSEAANYYMAKPLVDYFQANDDPRLDVMAVRYVGAINGGTQTEAVATRDPADQIGFPIGYDNNSIVPIAEADGVGSFYGYTQFDRNTVGKQTAAFFMLTYAQTQLLLAEGVVRGWVQGDAATYFANGIRAHMEQLAIHDANMSIPETEISTYIGAHPLVAGMEMELINVQYWVASIFNAEEAFANWRRSGYPVLTPNPYPQSGIDGDFIRRMDYDVSEYTNNLENINAAISRQGPDKLDTRVWWDKE